MLHILKQGTPQLLRYSLQKLVADNMHSFMLLMWLQLLCCTQAQLSPNFTAYIVTRDGIKLKTDVYFPNSEPPHNTIYEKTPYNADGLAGEAAYYVALGYAYMGQDCRGRYNSGGNYSFWRTSGNDTIDTLNWLINNQTWSTGHVSLSGISADAIAQYVDVSGNVFKLNHSLDTILV